MTTIIYIPFGVYPMHCAFSLYLGRCFIVLFWQRRVRYIDVGQARMGNSYHQVLPIAYLSLVAMKHNSTP